MGNFYLIADEAGLGKTTIANEMINRVAKLKKGQLRVIYVASNSRIARKNMEEFLNYVPDQIKKFQKDTAQKAVQAMYDADCEYRTAENAGRNCFAKYKQKLEGLSESQKKNYQGDRLSMYHKSGIYSDSNGTDPERIDSFVISLSPKTSFLKGYMDLSGTEEERSEMRKALCKLYQFKTNNCDPSDVAEFSNNAEFYAALETAIWYEVEFDIYKELELDIKNKEADGSNSEEGKKNKETDGSKSGEELFKEKSNKDMETRFIGKIKALKELAKANALANSNADKVSPLVRRVFENANIILMKPDIIILDEFQRFNDIFQFSKDGYSILMLYRFVRWLSEKNKCKGLLKLVLLSATPYKYDHTILENVWEMELKEEGGPKETDQEKPFENFEELIRAICQVTGDKEEEVNKCRGNYYERTQRNDYFTEDDVRDEADKNKATITVDAEQYRKHLEYLSSVYLINNEPDPDQRMRWLEQAPDFWRFCEGYDSLKGIDAEKYGSINNHSVEDHLKLSTLIEKGMPEGSELLLWVAPTKHVNPLEGPFQEFALFGKTLVFTHYRMAAKSVAANLTEIAEKRLEDALKNNGNFAKLEKIDAKEAHFQDFSLEGKDNPSVITALAEFFNTSYVKKVVFAAWNKYKKERPASCKEMKYKDMVKDYCEWGCLQDVLLEYGACQKKKEDALKHLSAVLQLQLGKYSKSPSRSYQAAVYYTDDDADSETHNHKYEDNLGERFNSPFFPFVMAVTATAQEGLDFHKYADKIMHWEPALNVNAFQQREGRIDRMGSITIRRRFYELCQNCQDWMAKGPFDFFHDMKDAERAKEIFDLLPEDKKGCVEKAFEEGLFPMWYVPKLSDKSAQIERIIATSYFSKEYDAFDKLVRGVMEYSKPLSGDKYSKPLEA